MSNPVQNTRHAILRELKLRGGASQIMLAKHLGLTREGVRQQLALLESKGWIYRKKQKTTGRGRPTYMWRLTELGEEQFPKFYNALTVALIHALGERYGENGLHDVLASITDQQVSAWEPILANKTLHERIEALRGIYFDQDPFTEVQKDEHGEMLIEHNCPYLSAATDEPRLCSVTVSTMKRLLGVDVARTERFQRGDGRCVFRIHNDNKISSDFRFEWETTEPD